MSGGTALTAEEPPVLATRHRREVYFARRRREVPRARDQLQHLHHSARRELADLLRARLPAAPLSSVVTLNTSIILHQEGSDRMKHNVKKELA